MSCRSCLMFSTETCRSWGRGRTPWLTTNITGAVVPGYAARFHAKPGITGLAQVSGLRGQTETVEDMAARVAKDLEYIRDWSLFSDIKILFLTVLTFLFHPAAY